MLVFLSKNTKQHNFVFCGLNQHFVFFSLFSSDDKKDQHIFFSLLFSPTQRIITPCSGLFLPNAEQVSSSALPYPNTLMFSENFSQYQLLFTHKMFVLLCHGQMLSCDKTQLTQKIEKPVRILTSLCITPNFYKREGFALLC